MKETNSFKGKNNFPEGGLKETLEKKYIDEYLLSKGYGRKALRGLPKEEARLLMVQASIYASLKLADIESRSRLIKRIHWIS